MNDMKQTNHLKPRDILHGQMVHLRPPQIDELSFIRKLWSDPKTMTAVGGPVDLSESKALKWFTHMVDPGGPANCYCLILNKEDIPVGEISFHSWDPDKRTAELNVKVLASHRGHGYAKDALRIFLEFFFRRVEGCVMTDDVAVRAVETAAVVFAVEPVSRLRQFIRKRAEQKDLNNLYVSDGFNHALPFPDSFADVIITSHALGWKLQKELKEFKRVVKKPGVIIHCPGTAVGSEENTHKILTNAPWLYRYSEYNEPDGCKRKY